MNGAKVAHCGSWTLQVAASPGAVCKLYTPPSSGIASPPQRRGKARKGVEKAFAAMKNANCCANGQHSGKSASRRRLILGSATLFGGLWNGIFNSTISEAADLGQVRDVRTLEGLHAFWDILITETRKAVGDDFSAALIFYQRGAPLPSGTPGDPAMDFASSGPSGNGSCGSFQPESFQPYALCPASSGGSATPAETPGDILARDCCRHYAFCVPYSRFAFSDIDRQSTVVASSRMAMLPPETWQAILMHEMGHAIDFYVFGGRYGLYDHKSRLALGVSKVLNEIDATEDDAEFRADNFANALLADTVHGNKLCYNPDSTLQVLVDRASICLPPEPDKLPAGNSTALLEHWPHAPAQGGRK